MIKTKIVVSGERSASMRNNVFSGVTAFCLRGACRSLASLLLAFGAMAFWEDTLRYLYLPRLKNRSVLEQAIVKGASSRDFFGMAYGHHDGKFDGFKLGDANIQLDDTLLLIEPEAAKAYEAANPPVAPPPGFPDTPACGHTPPGPAPLSA